MKTFSSISPTQSPEYQKQKLLAELYLDMHELFEKHFQNPYLSKLRLLLKPRKAVEVTGAIPKQKLFLCPASVQIKHSSKQPEDAMFQIATPMADCYFWVQPYMQLPKAEGDVAGFLNPAFLVQGLTDADGLNMGGDPCEKHEEQRRAPPIAPKHECIAPGRHSLHAQAGQVCQCGAVEAGHHPAQDTAQHKEALGGSMRGTCKHGVYRTCL